MRRKELLNLLDEYILENFTDENVFDAKNFSVAYGMLAFDKDIFDVEEFIASKPKPKPVASSSFRRETRSPISFVVPEFSRVDVDKVLEEKSAETFSEMLVRLVKESGKKPSEIYKRADVDRQIYSRIKNNSDYQPSKDTAVAFAIALKLDLPTAKKLLETAGYALSNAVKRDVIISFFFEKKFFSVKKLNEILYEYEQNVLFSRQ